MVAWWGIFFSIIVFSMLVDDPGSIQTNFQHKFRSVVHINVFNVKVSSQWWHDEGFSSAKASCRCKSFTIWSVHGAVTIPNHPVVLIWVRINFGKISTVGLSPRLIKTYVLKGRPAFPHGLPDHAYIRALCAHWALASIASWVHEQPWKHLRAWTCPLSALLPFVSS